MPTARPPLILRAAVGAFGMVVLVFIAAVMLSDRAPGLLQRLGGDVVARLSNRIDAAGRLQELTSDPRVPPSDALVHIALWAVAVVFVGLAVWHWGALVLSAGTLFAVSVAIELAQGRVTDTRVVATSDVLANATGIVAGTAVVGLCYLTWSGVARLVRGPTRAFTERSSW